MRKLTEIIESGLDDLDGKLKSIDKKLGHNDAYCIIDSDPEIAGSGWASGACYLLALALKRILPNSRLVSLHDHNGNIQHIMVHYNGKLVDGDGVSTEAEVLKRWENEEMVDDPYINYNFDGSDIGAISKPKEETIERLIRYLD